jgi:hypothetical protein
MNAATATASLLERISPPPNVVVVAAPTPGATRPKRRIAARRSRAVERRRADAVEVRLP